MSFAVICKSCQARFLLNDDLLRRRVAGRVVTVRCRQCHASIEVDGSEVDLESLPEKAAPEPPPPPAFGKIRAPKPAPAPPRPTAKSTLMGIGATRPAATTELVALSPGMLSVNATPGAASPGGFPEPPPAPGAAKGLDPNEWDIEEIAPSDKEEAVPESLDDFAEELPPSQPPEEEIPSSTGTPSLKALTHHDEHEQAPRADDFLANMSAAMNGGMMTGAPTIDVSGLAAAPAPAARAPSIDVSTLDAPLRGGQTMPLFALGDDKPAAAATPAPAAKKPGPQALKPAAPAAASAATEGSLSPATLDPPRVEPESARERKNVLVPATKSVPPPAAAQRASGLAAPLLLALAAAAGFLIWKRNATEAPARAEASLVAPAPVAPAPVQPAAVTPTPEPALTASAAAPAAAPDDMTFVTTPVQQAPATGVAHEKPSAVAASETAPKPATEAKPDAAPAVVKEEPKPEPTPAPAAPSEPSGPFDRAAAVAALTASAGQASSCRKEGDPSGVASVVVTFAPSGRVTSANISGPPFAGTATGGCIANALRKTRVPAFEGDRVTVSKTVVIQ